MPAIRTLCVVPAPWPVAATPAARAMGHLLHALTRAGVDLVVVAPRPRGLADEALDRLGLARRLSPLVVDGAAIVRHEGRLPGGRGELILLEVGDDDARLARAALALAATTRFDVALAGDETPELVTLAHAGGLGRAVLLLDGAPTTPALADAIAAADAIAVPDGSLVDELAADAAPALAAALARARGRLVAIGRGAEPTRTAPPPDDAARAAAVAALRRRVGLPPLAGAPLVIAPPPFDLIDDDGWAALPRAGAQLVFLARDPRGVAAAERFPARCAAVTARGDEASAADLILFAHLPARRAPTPLAPLAAGVVAIAPHAGAFAAALVDHDAATGTGSGFLYSPHLPDDLVPTVRRAVHAFADPTRFAALRRQARAIEIDWHPVARRLVELLRPPRGKN